MWSFHNGIMPSWWSCNHVIMWSWDMWSCDHETCDHIIMSSGHHVIMSSCHHAIFHNGIMPSWWSCDCEIMWSYDNAIISSCHHTFMLSYHHVIMSVVNPELYYQCKLWICDLCNLRRRIINLRFKVWWNLEKPLSRGKQD